ncbi:MAG: DNA-3-methyladenine glycosylase I [Naasia sp.]
MTTIDGPDGLARCGWVGRDPEYLRYHDEEWGVPLHGDRALFEKLSLEAFQSGLSWITILKRRPGFRAAFAGFDAETVAEFTADDVARLLDDTGIIRNRAKIESTISNAGLLRDWRAAEGDGVLDRFIWSFAPPPRDDADRPDALTDLAATSPESVALSRALRGRGFRFVGPTTAYALMQSAGLVDDHLRGCFRAGAHPR